MKVFIVLALAFAHGFALPAGDAHLTNLPAGIQIVDTPIAINNLPSGIQIIGTPVEISNQPADVQSEDAPVFSHLPSLESGNVPSFSNLPAGIPYYEEAVESENAPVFSVLPGGIIKSEVEAPVYGHLPSVESGAIISHLPGVESVESDAPVFGHLPSVDSGAIISHLPGVPSVESDAPVFGHLPSVESGAIISHLPGVESGAIISHLPGVESGAIISHLPGVPSLDSGLSVGNDAVIGHLPANEQAESTPACVKYVRQLLQEVLVNLPGSAAEEDQESSILPIEEKAPSNESSSPSTDANDINACARCFQKLQVLIEQANARSASSSITITNF